MSLRFVRLVIGALEEPAAATVAEAFLADVLAAFPRRYVATLHRRGESRAQSTVAR